jgi:protein TonB
VALAWQNEKSDRPALRRGIGRGGPRPARAEPDIAIPQSAIDGWSHEETNVVALFDADQPLAHRPGAVRESPAPKPAAARSRFWKASVVTSCLLHLAIAAAFVQLATDEVQIEGGEQAQVALLGNAPEDQLSAGEGPDAPDPDVTSVTLVTMLDATPVETVEAALMPVESVEPMEAVDSMQPTDPAEIFALRPEPVDTVEPVRPDPVQQPIANQAVQPVRPDEALAPAVATPVAPAAETEPLPQVAASPYPKILTAERIAPVSDERLTPLASETPSQTTVQSVEVPPVEPIEAAPALPVEAEPAEPVNETVQARSIAEIVPLAPAAQSLRPEPAETVATLAPVPEDAPFRKAEPKPAKKPEPKVAKPEKPKPAKAKPAKAKTDTKAKQKAERTAKAAKTRAGLKGSNQADARRGDADGAADGRSAARSNGARKSTAAGNAAVSNYPGKIVSKLRRALRYPPAAKRQGLRGEVQVAFTVSAGGGIGGVRVVRSSGSPILDRAAVDTVRRAAPFPAIPAGAGRSSWPFTVPLAFTR